MITRRARRWITRGLTISLLAAVVGFFVVTWFQAGTVDSGWLAVSSDSTSGQTTVLSVGAGTIGLAAGGGSARPGTWGLVFEGGRAIVGEVVGSGDGSVQRVLTSISAGMTPGTVVRFDRALWGIEQAQELGFEPGFVDGEVGALPIWTMPGADDTVVVFVHGNGATPAESFRLAQAIGAAGFPVLVVSYRNDGTADGVGRHGYGRDEWRDLDSVLDNALRGGASDFVLVGFGSGASIVGSYLYEGRQADRVVAVVLDAPVLSLGGLIGDDWSAHGVPGWVIRFTKAISSMRYGLDLGAIDHVARVAEWVPSTLILHGRADDVFPLEASEAFAVAKGDGALLLTFPDAGPGASWNTDPIRYESAVIGFLGRTAAGPSRFEAVQP